MSADIKLKRAVDIAAASTAAVAVASVPYAILLAGLLSLGPMTGAGPSPLETLPLALLLVAMGDLLLVVPVFGAIASVSLWIVHGFLAARGRDRRRDYVLAAADLGGAALGVVGALLAGADRHVQPHHASLLRLFIGYFVVGLPPGAITGAVFHRLYVARRGRTGAASAEGGAGAGKTRATTPDAGAATRQTGGRDV
jgi:hypothetical protein